MHLQQACHSTVPFIGALDLAKYAKERCVISNISKTSLPDLCALVLHKRFNKNLSEQVSEMQADTVLTEAQLGHAAQGAYASLCIYEKLAKITVLQPLPTAINPSLPVLLYSTDNTTVIAQGIISQHLNDHLFDGFDITPTRTVIDISKVLVPGAILTTHGRRSLKSFGKTPFSVVCLRSHLRLIDPTVILEESGSLQSTIQPKMVSEDFAHSELVELPSGDSEELEGESTISLAPLLSQDLSGPFIDPSSDKDPASLSLGCEILGADPETWDYTIYSRVLKDPWHVFHMFQISATHGLRKQFTRELRDAIFIPDSADRTRIDSWGAIQSPPRTYMSLRNSSSEWLRQRCKHIIPPPHILYPLVANVFRTYGPIVDPDSQKPLFNSDNWKTAKNVLELIKNGYLSDPPGVALYTAIGIDKKAGGLPIYRCARGTNSTEGGVHAQIRSRLPKFGTSIRHLQVSLLDFVLRHNLLVCISSFEVVDISNFETRLVHITQQASVIGVITPFGSPILFKNILYLYKTCLYIQFKSVAGSMAISTHQPQRYLEFFLFLILSGPQVAWQCMCHLQEKTRNTSFLPKCKAPASQSYLSTLQQKNNIFTNSSQAILHLVQLLGNPNGKKQ